MTHWSTRTTNVGQNSIYTSYQLHSIKFISLDLFYQIYSIRFIPINSFYQIHFIKFILSNLFHQSHFIKFILANSFHQIHSKNSFQKFIPNINFKRFTLSNSIHQVFNSQIKFFIINESINRVLLERHICRKK